MTRTEYKSRSGYWFAGKEAIAEREIRSKGGAIIAKGEKIVLRGKHGRGGFTVFGMTGGAYITMVDPDDVDFDFSKHPKP